MKKFAGVLIVFLAVTNSRLEAQPAINSPYTKTTTEKLDEYLVSASKLYKFNGSVLVAEKGKILLQKGYGFKNVAANTVNDSNSIFEICSITKQFTAAVILKLQEEGKLSVLDKLGKYFPDYKYGDKITLLNLLTHTSGIYNYTNDIDDNDSAIVCNPVAKQQVLDIFYKKSLDFKPGSKFNYDNSGYYLLGMIIEKVTGKPYEAVVRETIFVPLQMIHSGFDFRNLKDTCKATGYKSLNKNGQIIAQRWDSTVTYAAGAIYSTTGDMYKWAKAVANKEIISADSWKQAFTPYLDKYGYGWWIDSLYGENYVTHSGGMPGFMSNIIYYAGENATIILLNNEGNYGESLWQINMGLSAILFGRPYGLFKAYITIDVPDSVLKQYVGVYEFDKKHKLYITLEKGQLQVEAPAGKLPRSPLFAEDINKFYLKVVEAELEFVRGADGNITQLISHANGKDDVCKKIK